MLHTSVIFLCMSAHLCLYALTLSTDSASIVLGRKKVYTNEIKMIHIKWMYTNEGKSKRKQVKFNKTETKKIPQKKNSNAFLGSMQTCSDPKETIENEDNLPIEIRDTAISVMLGFVLQFNRNRNRFRQDFRYSLVKTHYRIFHRIEHSHFLNIRSCLKTTERTWLLHSTAVDQRINFDAISWFACNKITTSIGFNQ